MTKEGNKIARTIPRPIRREVRQRCGFGCVICGCPIYNYDHIEEFSTVNEHSADNLVLLCPTCHMKKGKLLTKAMIRNALDRCSRERTSPDRIPHQHYVLDIGGNIVQNFSGGCVFQIWDFGHLDIIFNEVPSLTAVICGESNTNAIEIIDNEYTLSSNTWDIEYVGKTLIFRSGPRNVFCSIKIDVDEAKIEIRGDVVMSNGVRIQIKDNGIFANSMLLASNNLIIETAAAITITGAEVNHPYMFSGHVYRNSISGIAGISGLNTSSCDGNVMHKCELAFVWTLDFLSQLGKPA